MVKLFMKRIIDKDPDREKKMAEWELHYRKRQAEIAGKRLNKFFSKKREGKVIYER